MWWIAATGCSFDQDPHPPVALAPPEPRGGDRPGGCDRVGPPRVDQVADRVWVAVGFDLANTTVIGTSAGPIVVDVGSSVERAAAVRAAMPSEAFAGGDVVAVVYTHGHLDHTAGAAAWVDPDTVVIGTERLAADFYDRYGAWMPAESMRAARQFGRDVPSADADGLTVCPSIGPPIAFDGTIGPILPTRPISGPTTLTFGDRALTLVPAPGETDDQLFGWLPDSELALCGDNWYAAFPNLYTIRGTRPRPVDAWIASLDALRRYDPAILVPGHTSPVVGRDAVRRTLRDHRDAIQWVRDAVVRGANAGLGPDALAAEVRLPEHLRSNPALAETYGQVDWSVRGLYDGGLGWFDGRASALYPLPADTVARRTIDAMGGEARVTALADEARDADPRWSAHLYALLEDGGAAGPAFDDAVGRTYERLARDVDNANGRAYLLQAAIERRDGVRRAPIPDLPDRFVDAIPLALLFRGLAARLRPQDALDVEESVRFVFPDEGQAYVVTVRHGVAEVVDGDPLPGTPAPLATVTLSATTWRRIALRKLSPVSAVAAGSIGVAGSELGLLGFLARFDRDPEPARALP